MSGVGSCRWAGLVVPESHARVARVKDDRSDRAVTDAIRRVPDLPGAHPRSYQAIPQSSPSSLAAPQNVPCSRSKRIATIGPDVRSAKSIA